MLAIERSCAFTCSVTNCEFECRQPGIMSILLRATTNGTLRFFNISMLSYVWGSKPLLTSATSMAMSAAEPPRLLRFAKTSWPGVRSEEHTSELQSHSDLVCRLLLEKKK